MSTVRVSELWSPVFNTVKFMKFFATNVEKRQSRKVIGNSVFVRVKILCTHSCMRQCCSCVLWGKKVWIQRKTGKSIKKIDFNHGLRESSIYIYICITNTYITQCIYGCVCNFDFQRKTRDRIIFVVHGWFGEQVDWWNSSRSSRKIGRKTYVKNRPCPIMVVRNSVCSCVWKYRVRRVLRGKRTFELDADRVNRLKRIGTFGIGEDADEEAVECMYIGIRLRFPTTDSRPYRFSRARLYGMWVETHWFSEILWNWIPRPNPMVARSFSRSPGRPPDRDFTGFCAGPRDGRAVGVPCII